MAVVDAELTNKGHEDELLDASEEDPFGVPIKTAS
jgi:hypothetical protein